MHRVLAAVACGLTTLFVGIPIAFAPGDVPQPLGPMGTGIPAVVLAAYQRADGACPGLRWQLLAGIGMVESGHGTTGGAVADPSGRVAPSILGPPLDGTGVGGNTTPLAAGQWAGQWGVAGPWLQAVGPMQFLPPTFSEWAVDGDADGVLDPHDIDDAVATAAAYLCGPSAGITAERSAVRRYNASDEYVEEVLLWAERYAASSPLVVTGGADAAALLANPNVQIYGGGREDLASGRIDARVVAVLAALAQEHTVVVTSLVAGHPRCAVTGQPHGPGCVASNHYFGRGADIALVDGIPISVRHPDVAALMNQLTELPAPYRPDEIGGPIDTGQPGVFTNTFHADHIHIGWDE